MAKRIQKDKILVDSLYTNATDNRVGTSIYTLRKVSFYSEWIRSAVSLIKKNVSKAYKFNNFKITTPMNLDDDESKDPKIKELVNFFQYPNEDDSLQSLMKVMMEDLLVLDAGACQIAHNYILNKPAKLYRLDGGNLKINVKTDKSGRIVKKFKN